MSKTNVSRRHTPVKKKASPVPAPKETPSNKPANPPGATRKMAIALLTKDKHPPKIGASTIFAASMMPAHDKWTLDQWVAELERIERLAAGSVDSPDDPNSERVIGFDDAALRNVGAHHGAVLLEAIQGPHTFEEGPTRPAQVAHDLERVAHLVEMVELFDRFREARSILVEPLLYICADTMRTAAGRLRIAHAVDNALVSGRSDTLEHLRAAQHGAEVQS